MSSRAVLERLMALAQAQVDTSGLTLEEGLFRNFDDIIRRQLDAVWHTVSPRTKQA